MYLLSCSRVHLVMIWARLRLILAQAVSVEGSKWYGNVLGKSLENPKLFNLRDGNET